MLLTRTIHYDLLLVFVSFSCHHRVHSVRMRMHAGCRRHRIQERMGVSSRYFEIVYEQNLKKQMRFVKLNKICNKHTRATSIRTTLFYTTTITIAPATTSATSTVTATCTSFIYPLLRPLQLWYSHLLILLRPLQLWYSHLLILLRPLQL